MTGSREHLVGPHPFASPARKNEMDYYFNVLRKALAELERLSRGGDE